MPQSGAGWSKNCSNLIKKVDCPLSKYISILSGEPRFVTKIPEKPLSAFYISYLIKLSCATKRLSALAGATTSASWRNNG